MNDLLLFTDGSVNTRTKIGIGSYLLVSDPNLELDDLKKQIVVTRFENTSSTKLELQTLLWALKLIGLKHKKIIAYTDSQNILSLKVRRENLQKNNYLTSKKTLMKNHILYEEFFRFCDQLNIEFIKVKGHCPSKQKSRIEQLFTLVDRASRKALRTEQT